MSWAEYFDEYQLRLGCFGGDGGDSGAGGEAASPGDPGQSDPGPGPSTSDPSQSDPGPGPPGQTDPADAAANVSLSTGFDEPGMVGVGPASEIGVMGLGQQGLSAADVAAAIGNIGFSLMMGPFGTPGMLASGFNTLSGFTGNPTIGSIAANALGIGQTSPGIASQFSGASGARGAPGEVSDFAAGMQDALSNASQSSSSDGGSSGAGAMAMGAVPSVRDIQSFPERGLRSPFQTTSPQWSMPRSHPYWSGSRFMFDRVMPIKGSNPWGF